MIVASRLCRPDHAAFDGTGGLVRAGRWHEQGNRVVYAAASEALAALEVLIRLSSVDQFPNYICVKVSIPESLVADLRDFAVPPHDWSRRDSREARAIGTRWLRDEGSAVLRVPSVVIPRESNYLLNPSHARFSEIELSTPLAFEFDIRLLGKLQ